MLKHLVRCIVLAGFVSLAPLAIASSQSALAGTGTLSSETQFEAALATYRITLASAPDSRYAVADGTFSDKLQFTCSGRKVEQRLTVKLFPPANIVGAQGAPTILRSGANALESLDGLTYRFEDKTSMNGQVISAHKGEVVMRADGSGGIASYTVPQQKEMGVPADALFPVKFSEKLLEAAAKGQQEYIVKMFDGAMGLDSGTLDVKALIGSPRVAAFKQFETKDPESRGEFTTALAWPVKVSATKHGDVALAPLFEQLRSVLPNGRAETMVLDFGQFKLRFELTSYEPLAPDNCAQ